MALKHGLHGTPEYWSWKSMNQRCRDPNATNFNLWGGRGISVCERWRNSFSAFLADMGPRPSGMSLDRIDNARGYEPGNCRWASAAEQQRNRRDNRLIELNGSRLTPAEWAERTGINKETIIARIKRGWLPERALTEAPKRSAT